MNNNENLSGTNASIQKMLSSGEIKNFYRFVAQNPHLTLREACQIIIERPNASVCFSFEEWNAMDRRINKGCKGIPYKDNDGQKRFVYDSADTHGDGRYRRLIYPMKRLLKGLDVLNGTAISEDLSGDYKRIQSGVTAYLNSNDYFTDDEEYNNLLSEGVSYYLYCKTGFPKNTGISLSGLPYDMKGNADFFMNVKEVADNLQKEVEEAYIDDLNKVVVIEDTEEENVSDEPVMPSRTEIAEEEIKPKENPKVRDHPLNPIYEQYMEMQEKYPNAVVLYRLGDFYEIFGDKAKTIGEELDLTITGRDFGLSERVPMVGFPYHVTDAYISKIVEKHSVLLLEPDAEPKYILSHDEAMAFNSEQEKSKRPALEPIEDEELNKELDELLSEREQESEEDDDEITEEDWAEAEEYLNNGETGTESEQEETVQPQKEKSIRERKKKQKPQLSFFDLIDGNAEGQKEETYEDRKEKFIKQILTGGSGVSQGKFRIVENYNSDPSAAEFANFLKNEYGTGGSYGGGIDKEHGSKGLSGKYTDNANPENNIDFFLNWNEVATRIADLIDAGEYFNAEEKEEYKQFLAERTGTDRERNKAIINHIIKEARSRDARGYYRVWCSSLYADYSYLHDHSDEINEEIVKLDGISDSYFRDNDFYVYGQALDKKNNFHESDLEILEHKRELLESAKSGYIGLRIQRYAEYMFLAGTTSTNNGNWIFYFNEFGEEENFVREHAAAIGKELCLSKGVENLSIDDDCIDVNFYTDFCPNLREEHEETDVKTTPQSEFNRFKELSERNKAFFEKYSKRPIFQPTDSLWGDVQNCTEIASGIYSVSTSGHGGIMITEELAKYILTSAALKVGQVYDGYYCYEEDCDKNVALRELYDKGILTQDSKYFTESYVKSDDSESEYKPFKELSNEEKAQFFKEWSKTVDESLAYWNKGYWQAHENIAPVKTVPQIEKPIAENTDLNEIGFDQSELGGLKARFQANLEAIRLLNKLYAEDRLPTKSEQLVLAKYVGWGGLAKAFDEHDANWQKEYNELKNALNSEDYDKAKASVLNAHYTSKDVIQGIYGALARMGVKGNNRILEPAMGTGNFFGYMPKEIADGARLYGVELDTITGKLAQKLYPNANIQIKGFEQTSFSNNRFDIVVGNVPFGAYTVYDSDYAKQNFYIHDYFLAKSIDKLKPNGLMAVITSSGTMDKLNPSVRKYLAERAELLGAIRLPNTAFKQNAGTEVVADILFFRKREQQEYVTPENTEWLGTGKTEQGYEINNYFINHPEMVLGTLAIETGMYGATDVTVKPDGRTISEALSQAIEHLPQDIYVNPEYTEEQKEEISVDYNVKPLCYKAENGRLYMRVGDEMVEQDIPKSPKDAFERITEMINLRNELRYVLDIQTEGCSDEKLQSEQRVLNANYDRFVKRFGRLNSKTNANLFREDADSALLFACEDVSEDKTTISKADIFSKRTIRPYVQITSTDDCFEALQISRNERGNVDISYIEELTGKDYDTVLSELGNAVFRNPVSVNPDDMYSGFETSEEYLSGNVVKKLETAREYANDNPALYEKNVAALESVQPEPIPASDIGVRIGASWVDKKYYTQFLRDLLKLPSYYSDAIELYYNRFDSSWRVDKKSYTNWCSQELVNEVYGTGRANAYRLFEDCLNLRDVKIYDRVENDDGSYKRVLNQAETIAAREKQNKIKEAFADWIFNDPERRSDLEQAYNSTFNQTVLPVYDGSHLRFPGMNPAIELKPHQKNAVHRMVSTGDNTLLHHVVGSGKTFTMFATGMKLRQYGLAKKIMCAVPNHLVEQWASQGRLLYPNAKILVATKEDLAKDKRKRFVSKVAMGDWDFIIIAQSSFAKIPISPERQIRKIQEEIQRIEETIENTWMEKGMPRGAVKNLEKIKKNREAQLKKLLDDDKKDNVLIFENLGVDYLFIDEAHYYKNKFLFTKMNNVAGISTTASQRASDLELKCEYINELHGGDKGVVFATGTPISNSMTEMYTMQSYLQKEKLQDVGITFFDNWAANFGETITSLEMAPSGQGYKAKTRFSKFTNLPELLTMYRSFADVQTQDMVKLDVPDVDRKVINLKPSDTVLSLADEIAERAEEISHGSVPPEIDNMLKITSDGKKLALDPRCFDTASADENGSKLNECASRIFEIWGETTDFKGTQIVFCDLSTPKKAFDDYVYGKDFDVYNDLKYKLVEKGIPKEEIAFIHDPKTDEQKQDLFNKVNAGKVRVLIGSTEKCGAGTNVQERLIALHHLDTPYRPSDMQQREGRIIRQGNKNKQVQIYTYVTERTFDSYSYQILENKQKFISQIDRGDLTVREAEDIDERTLTYAEIKAITAANPKIKRKMEVDTEIARLRVLEGQYKKNLYALQDKVRKTYPEDIQRQTLYLERLRADIATVKAKYNPDVFSVNVQGKTYTDKKEGSQALMDALMHNRSDTIVAEYGGLKISLDPITMIASERTVTLTGVGKYSMTIGESASGLITRLDNFLTDFPEREKRAEGKLEQLKSDLKVAEEQVTKPFEHKDKLAELVKEQAELNAELDLNRREEVVIDDEKEENIVESAEGDNYMGIPEQTVSKTRFKPRKRASGQISKTYNKVKSEEPDAYVFIKNGSNYEIYGEQAEKLSEQYELPVITDTVSGKETSVLSVESKALDRIIMDVVASKNKVKIVEEMMEEKEESFIDENETEETQADILPDYSINQEEMFKYGYKQDDMLPLRKNTAKLLYEIGLPVRILNAINTDEAVPSVADIIHRKELNGIKKADWQEFINSDKGFDYLYARYFFSESALKTLNEDMSYMDGMYVDGLSNAISEEKSALEEYLPDDKIPVNEQMKPFVIPLLDYFVARFDDFPLNHYGWDKEGVYSAIANNISGESLSAMVKEQNEERKLENFIDRKIDKLAWIINRTYSSGDIDDIVKDLKPYFENSEYDGGFKGDEFDRYYDEFAEEKIVPYLESQAEDEEMAAEPQWKYDYLLEGVNFDEPQKVKTYFAYLKEWFSEHSFSDNQFPVIWDEFFNNEMEDDALAEYFTELAETNPIDNYDQAQEFIEKCNALGVAEELLLACDIRDVEITLEDGQIVARNEGLEWKGKDFYEFLLHDVVEIDRHGKLLDGYGVDQSIVDDLIKHEKMFEDTPQEIDYAKEVTESVEKEFDEFRDNLTKEPQINVFYKNYEIHVKTELYDVISDVDFSEDVYKTLYQDRGHILQTLYDGFISATAVDKERFSVETYGDTSEFIEEYCKRQLENESSEIEQAEPQTIRDKLKQNVQKEYNEFIHEEMERTKEQLIHTDNYKIRFFNELVDFLGENIETCGITDRDVEALLTEENHVLDSLYDYYLDSEYNSINNYEDTKEFIENYNDRYHEDMVEDRYEYEWTKPDATVAYFGEDERGIRYYHFKYDGLSLYKLSDLSDKRANMVIAANYLAMPKEDLNSFNITFLKVGRDITEEELADKEHVIESMQNAVERVKQAKKQDLKDNIACKNAIEKAISENFDGMHLKKGFENEVIAKHGLSRVKYVLSNTLQQKDGDGRFSSGNREWGFKTDIEEPIEQRYLFTVDSHPAVLNGFIDLFRKKEKRFEESMQIYYTKQAEMNADGSTSYQAYILNEDTGIMFPAFTEDFESKEALDEAFNNFAYRNGFDYYEKSPEELFEMSNEILNKKEGQEMPQNETKIDKSLSGEFLEKTKGGYMVVNITKDDDDRNIAIVYRQKTDDYVVAIHYDANDGTWAQGLYVSTFEQAEEMRAKQYGDKPKIYENKEWKKEMAENENTENKKKWINVLTSRDAFIKKYDKSSFMRMPLSGDYSGYTYFLYNDRIKNATQIADLESDSREFAYSLRIGEDETIRIENRETEDMVELSAEEFNEAVGGTTSKDYVRYNDKGEKRWTTMSVPSVAMRGTYDKSAVFIMPNNAEFKGSFYVPNSFVSEDTDSDEERLRIAVPDDFTFTVKNKETEESEKLSAYQLFRAINGTKVSDYERERTEKQSLESPEKKDVQPQEKKNDNGWKYVSVPNAAFITEYEKSDMFRMPKGQFEKYCYFLPHELLRFNEEKGTVAISLPETFAVTLNNRNAKKEEERKIEMTAEDFVAQVKGKKTEDYEQYQKPSETKVDKFSANEEKLRENVPEEMKQRPNWVIVRTKENTDTGRLEKYLIDVHTGKFAESDNPETWTDFETACKYAKENGGVSLAYALDGKDGICCIDLDHCIDDQGNPSEIIADLIDKTRGSFAEKSVSGKGVHIFGKTKGMDVRAFSKDGKSEFYQKSHFITMTGDVMLKAELKDFDSLPVKDYLYDKHERRVELKGKGQGVEGLSRMSDRDVVDKAISSKGGDTFKALYNGQDLQNNHSNSDMSLMNRLAFWCNGDKEQMLRIFATSGLFRESKSPDYYEGTAIKAIRDTTNRFQPKEQTPVNKSFSNNSDKGGK